MKIIIVVVFVALAIFGVAARWYQVKDSLSIYLRPTRRKDDEQTQDADQPES
jgi:hypothetical protein